MVKGFNGVKAQWHNGKNFIKTIQIPISKKYFAFFSIFAEINFEIFNILSSFICLCLRQKLNKKRMARFDKENLKVRILKLASMKSTGSPADLANRFEISERSVKRIVKEIREEGKKIRFCQTVQSYVTGVDYY